jgi:hypothetical protein
MKKSFLLLVLLFSMFFVSGQSSKDSTKVFNLTDIDISSGKGALTSGLFVYCNLESQRAFLQTTIGGNDIEITYLFRLFKDRILVGPNLGYFFNMPYGGPQLVFAPCRFIETLHWYGWSMGKPEGKIDMDQAGMLFGVNAVSLKAWRLKATYCLINYMDNAPQHTVSLKYSQRVSKNFLIYTDLGYDFKNECQLLKIGVNWRPY